MRELGYVSVVKLCCKYFRSMGLNSKQIAVISYFFTAALSNNVTQGIYCFCLCFLYILELDSTLLNSFN